uniref:CARD domain-containing protein n=1 Tax=Branchiostoma floridae TaxID=7739 RepID=C3YVA8_BRAFL|eukprot:XP_002599812.1 hypothetical protein BRAFLDRAFT_70282 [Branchiostoma floridae]
MDDLPLAQDKQLVRKLRQVLQAIRDRNLMGLQTLLLEEDMPDLNYLVQLSDHGDKRQVTPLLHACVLNSPKMVGALVNAGAKVNCKVWGYSPLSHTISDGKVALVEKLLDCGAIPVKKDILSGESDLSRAMKLEHDTDSDRRTKQRIVSLLCKYGADVNSERSILHTAVNEGDFDICKILVDSGADKTALDRTGNGNTPLHVAVTRKSEVRLVELLCHQDSVNAYNTAGFTPLHLAADIGDKNVVWSLIQAGADINAQAPQTKLTPLDMAQHNHNKQVVDYLITCGQSSIEQEDRKQPVFARGRTAPPDSEKSQLRAKNLQLREEKQHLSKKLKSQEENHKQEVAELTREIEELKQLNGKLKSSLEQYQDKVYPGGCPRAMSERHRKLLTDNLRILLSDLHVNIVIPVLRENGILTRGMEEEIRSLNTQNDRNRKLLAILPTRGEVAFYTFRQVLREDPGSDHLAVLLNEEESGLPD